VVDVATRLVVALLPWHSGTADHPQAPKRPSRPPLTPTASQTRAETVQRPPGDAARSDGSSPRHHAAVAADRRDSLTTHLSRRCVKSTPGSVTASRRMPAHGLHHRLSSPTSAQRHLLLGRCNVTMRDFSVTADEASLCLLLSPWLGASMRPRSELPQ